MKDLIESVESENHRIEMNAKNSSTNLNVPMEDTELRTALKDFVKHLKEAAQTAAQDIDTSIQDSVYDFYCQVQLAAEDLSSILDGKSVETLDLPFDQV